MTWFGAWGKSHSFIDTARFKGIVSMITGPDNSATKSAAARQRETLAAQEAVQARARQREDTRETELSGQLATQRRAVAARRRGSQLAYTGPALQTTFGG